MTDQRKPIVLLDMDGVLNIFEHHRKPNAMLLMWKRVEVLRQVQESIDFDVVIISSWGYHHTDCDAWKWMFKTHGITLNVIDITSAKVVENEAEARSIRVNKWLADHDVTDRFCVIDDLPISCKRLIRPKAWEGLQPRHTEEIKRHLIK